MAKKAYEKPTVESIMAECAKEVRKGLGRKKLKEDAREFWTTTYEASIAKRLEDPAANWRIDRRRVLPVSKKLGKVAAALATGNVVEKWAVEAASAAVQSDPKCPSVGAGGYCDLDPI
jgi:hypothetical protein